MLPDPISLFSECLKKPEPLIDKAYCYDELIISKGSHCQPTEIMKTHRSVIERICAAKIAKNDQKSNDYKSHIQALDQLLIKNEYSQFLELSSFFPTMDVSFSAYKKLKAGQRLKFLKNLLERYLDYRHDIYMSHGYSPTTIQARKDFEKHKRQGGFAKQKIKNICEKLGYKPFLKDEKIIEVRQKYCFIDQKQGQKWLCALTKKGESWSKQWSKKYEGKQADILFTGNKGQYFICEAKHIKESGGGQDKQINELITFIDNENHQQEIHNVFYIAFLDGAYFNKFIETDSPSKIRAQKERIKKCLRHQNKRNFFVNTYGLKKLLRGIL